MAKKKMGYSKSYKSGGAKSTSSANTPKAVMGKRDKPGCTNSKSNTSGAEFNASAQGRKAAEKNMKATHQKLCSGPKNKKSNQGTPKSPKAY